MNSTKNINIEREETVRTLALTKQLCSLAKAPLKGYSYRFTRWILNDVLKRIFGKENRVSAWAPETIKQHEQEINEIQQALDQSQSSPSLEQSTVQNNYYLHRKKLLGISYSLVQAGQDIFHSRTYTISSFAIPFLITRRIKSLEKLLVEIRALNEDLSEYLPQIKKIDLLQSGLHPDQLISEARVDIVVCIHNAYDDVTHCIESIKQHTNLNRHRVILVDDGSHDKTKDYVRESSLQLQAIYHRNEEAQGFTRALNKGISLGKGDVIVSLNSDTIVGPYWINNMLTALAAHPRVAIVGPFSNAASWQSIPRLTDQKGSWEVNDIPENLTVDAFATLTEKNSIQYFPHLDVLNGFCLMLKRSVYDELNGFNEKDFPQGYGEEDDFLIRLKKLGWQARLADNTYVYHAKSKSFTPEGRKSRVVGSKEKLQELHGRDTLKQISRAMQENEELLITREWTNIYTVEKPTPHKIPKTKQKQRICWLQPHLEEVGGIRRVIEMTNFLVQSGHDVTIVTPSGRHATWLPLFAKVKTVDQASQEQFNLGIISDPDMIGFFEKLNVDQELFYHLGAYMLYREKSSDLTRFYEDHKQSMHITNSEWVADQIKDHYNIKSLGTFPGGIDQKLFFPHNAPKTHDIVCYGSKRPHKGTNDIILASKQFPHLSVLRLAELQLEQAELAYNICRGKVFVSACWHEGFNFCPLEAMSCGIPVVLTDDGGSREFAEHEKNCIVTPPKDPLALREAITLLLNDSEMRKDCIHNGLRTASKFTWEKICSDFHHFIENHAEPRQSPKTEHIPAREQLL